MKELVEIMIAISIPLIIIIGYLANKFNWKIIKDL